MKHIVLLVLVFAAVTSCSTPDHTARPALGSGRIVHLATADAAQVAVRLDTWMSGEHTTGRPIATFTADPAQKRILIAVAPGHADEMERILAFVAEMDADGLDAGG